MDHAPSSGFVGLVFLENPRAGPFAKIFGSNFADFARPTSEMGQGNDDKPEMSVGRFDDPFAVLVCE
jgi:hypothetical protein